MLPTVLRVSKKGLTLVELLVAVAILAVLLAVAVPAMNDWLMAQRVVSTTAQLVTDLNYARSETIKLNRSIRVTFNSDASQSCYTVHTTGTVTGQCSCLRGANSACLNPTTGAAIAGLTELKTVSVPTNSGVSIASTPVIIQFDAPTGLVANATTLAANVSGGSARQLRAVTNATGRPASCAPSGSSIKGYATCSD